MGEFVEKIQDSLKKKHTIALFCDCTVSYQGRAESFLGKGERVILIKKDGTLLIHQPFGNTPVNYMKEQATHAFSKEGEFYRLKSTHLGNKEFLEVSISEIHHLHTRALSDAQKITIAGTEKDMAEMIMGSPELISPNFKPCSREEHTKYGFIDVFGHNGEDLVVIECKRYTADLKAVSQLRRYVEKIKKAKGIDSVKGIIASPSISSNALKMLHDFGFSHKIVDPPKYLEKYKANQKSLSEF